MRALEDVEDMSALTRAEIDALAEHEHLTTFDAALMGECLMHIHHGPQRANEILCDDSRAALHEGSLLHARELSAVLRGYLANDPEAARGVR